MKLALISLDKKSINSESSEYFLNMGLVLRHIVRVDENAIQIDDDCDIDHICKNVIHKSLKSGGCISKPFRHYQPLKGTIMQSSIRLQVKSIQGGRRAGDQSWCRLLLFVVCLGGQK